MRVGGAHLVDAKTVIVDILGMLAVDGVELSVGGALGEERGDEKLREAIESAIEKLSVDVEEINCVLAVGVRVGTSSVS